MDKHKELQAIIEDKQVPLLTNAQEEEFKNKTLKFLDKVSASFMGELSWETGITDYQLKGIVYNMEKSGLIERVPVDFWKPDLRLLGRVPDQSARGQGGFDNFCKKRWFSLTKEGIREARA